MSRCPHARAVADTAPRDLGAALSAHARHCPDCGEELSLSAGLSELASRITPPDLSAGAASRIRGALLERARAPSSSPRAFGRIAPWAAVAAAGIAAAVVVTMRPTPRAEFRATVSAEHDTRFTHTRDLGDERIALGSGKVHVEVEHLKPGERFRVVTSDAEVEVRGTAFEVTARDGRLIAVRVESGVVEVRRPPQAILRLIAGESWPSPEPAAEPAPPPPAAAEPPAPAPPPKRIPTARREEPAAPPLSAAEPPKEEAPKPSEFDRAWTAMRSGDYTQAAELFAQAELTGRVPAEEAAYGRTIALARAGRREEAIAAMEKFVDRFPATPRKGTIAVALGWLLLDAGEVAEARRHFESAVGDAAAPVREAAQQGLAATAARPD